MKKIQNFAMACGVAATGLCGCEQVLEWHDAETPVDGITVNALATPDTVLMAVVSKALLFTDAPDMDKDKFEDFWIYEQQGDLPMKHAALISGAAVTAQVNGAEEYAFRYDAAHSRYVSDYRPREGDRILLTAQFDTFPAAEAAVSVPSSRRLELLSCQKKYSNRFEQVVYPEEHPEYALIDWYGEDTVAVVTVRFTDPPGDDYYRLKVRSISDHEDFGEPVVRVHDVFASDDRLFYDSRLGASYGGWPSEFSSVFDGRKCEGETRTVTVESRLRQGTDRRIEVELQSLSRDFYYYVKSCELYRITKQDDYSEPVQIHSNVEDGWGIFGGIASDGFVLHF